MTGQDRSAVAVPATTPRRRTSPAQPALASASTAETPAGAVGTPWLLVVARGQDHLVVALRALFRNDERIQVVEDRRDERGLLPRADTVRLAPSSATESPVERTPSAVVGPPRRQNLGPSLRNTPRRSIKNGSETVRA